LETISLKKKKELLQVVPLKIDFLQENVTVKYVKIILTKNIVLAGLIQVEFLKVGVFFLKILVLYSNSGVPQKKLISQVRREHQKV
jgi:hypothetical protein